MSSTETHTWQLDTVHSTAAFAVTHMGVSTFRAEFDTIEASFDGETLTGRVPVESVRLRDENLRGHLYGEDFFDVANTPDVSFQSSRIDRDGDTVTLYGDLTVKGTTEPVVANGTITGPTEDAFGGTRLGVELEAKIDRTKFGLNWNAPLPKGGNALGEEVTLVVHLEFSAA